MSALIEYKAKQLQLEELQKNLDSMGKQDSIVAALAIEEDLDKLTDGVETEDLVAMLVAKRGLGAFEAALNKLRGKANNGAERATKGSRKPRVEKRYVNPYTNEEVICKKATGKVLEWQKEHGKEKVETWVQQ